MKTYLQSFLDLRTVLSSSTLLVLSLIARLYVECYVVELQQPFIRLLICLCV